MISLAALLLAVAVDNATVPQRLTDTGLYVDRDVSRVDPRNAPYSPQYPLWSDGASKARWVSLPDGATIDVSDADAWRFPVGTKLWKEFAFGGTRVETRLMWLPSDGEWRYATYVWNDEQTEAWLAPDAGVPSSVEVRPGRRHAIPGIADCRACHEAGPSEVLGFNALQLSDDRDPLAPHAEPGPPGTVTLRSLEAAGRFDPPHPEWLVAPPLIRAASPVERAALGYLAANCGTCHNARGPLAGLGPDLSYPVAAPPGTPAPAVVTAVDAAGTYEVPGMPAGASRSIAPGSPEASAVWYRMRSRRPSSQMPPLGSVIADDEALALIETWIRGDVTGGAARGAPSP